MNNFDKKVFLKSKPLIKQNDTTGEQRGVTYYLNPEFQYKFVQEKGQVKLSVVDMKRIINGKDDRK